MLQRFSTHFRGGLTLDECTTLLLHAKHWADTLQKFRQEKPLSLISN